MDEIEEWPCLRCGHIHDANEWDIPDPCVVNRLPPHEEEKAYTACLCLHAARAATAWFTRTRAGSGSTDVRVPRAPRLENAGDRASWIRFDPRTLREWLVMPMVLAMGLGTEEFLGPDEGVPTRETVPADHRGPLPQGVVYVGNGHHSHRQGRSRWANPFAPGKHGGLEQCMAK